jgi:hypothetical protein
MKIKETAMLNLFGRLCWRSIFPYDVWFFTWVSILFEHGLLMQLHPTVLMRVVYALLMQMLLLLAACIVLGMYDGLIRISDITDDVPYNNLKGASLRKYAKRMSNIHCRIYVASSLMSVALALFWL